MPLLKSADLLQQDSDDPPHMASRPIHPRDMLRGAEPCHLALGVMTGFLLGPPDRLMEVQPSQEDADDVAIVVPPQRLHVRRIAGIQGPFYLLHPAARP